MKIEVNLHKKQVFIFLGAILFLAGITYVIAASPNPGHDPSEIGPGGIFGDGANGGDLWRMVGNLQLETFRDAALIIKDTDTTSFFSYIDWRDENDNRLFWVGTHNSDRSFRVWNTQQNDGLKVLESDGSVEVTNQLCLSEECRSGWYQQKKKPNGQAFSAQLLSGQDGTAEPDAEYTVVGEIDDFCALQNVQIGAGSSYAQAGCQLIEEQLTNFKILRAFRYDHDQEVYCSVICLEGPIANANA